MSIFEWLMKMIRKQTALSQQNAAQQQPNSCEQPSDEQSAEIGCRLDWLHHHLSSSSDVVFHTFAAGPELSCALVYVKGMVDLKTIEQSLLKPIMSFDSSIAAYEFCAQIFTRKQLPIAQQSTPKSLQEATSSILDGEVLLLVDGDARMVSFGVTTFEHRAIAEAPNEAVIRGPREAFIENLETNLTMVRRRLKTSSLKVEMMHVGTETHTSVAVIYLEGTCKQQLIDEVKKRLSDIKIDSVLGSSYLEEFIEDNPLSPFPQLQHTERPDVISAALLEGRVGILVNGTPIAIIAPVTLFMLLQSAEDYYQRYVAASWIRYIRYLFLFISLLLPSVYIAITTFHPDIIPERLLISVASYREVVPFPALVEAFLMEISFEALREATVRIPKSIGQSVSIIGALIIGNAAVDAGIASAAMVIIVSLTGVASFISPQFDLGLAFRLLRFPIMILAGTFGLFGIVCGMILIYLHLIELRSFGMPYLSPVTPMRPGDLKDTLGRAPWWAMKNRPSFSNSSRHRQRLDSRKWAQSDDEGD
jgi:spore germination protein